MMQVYSFLIKWYWAMSILTLIIVVSIESAPGLSQSHRGLLYWLFILVVAVPSSIILYLGSRQRAKEYSPAPGAPIAFSEKRVTGHSNTSKMSSFLMVKGALIVEVADETIYIRPRSAGRGDVYREFQRIPTREVTLTERVGDRLRLTWAGETSGDFTLILKNPDAFLQSIHRTSLGTPLAY